MTPFLPITRRCALRPTLNSRTFHTTAKTLVNAGDRLPDLKVLVEGSPGNKVNLREQVPTKGLIIGVPAAFSPSCSNSHLPAFMRHPRIKEVGDVFVVAVNDPFVMKAWAEQMDPDQSSGIRFLGDPTAKFTEALELAFDGAAIFGGPRSKRYALLLEDGQIAKAYVEPDNTGVNGNLPERLPSEQRLT